MTARAALYLRMSLDRTGEGAGVDRQEAACRALADARGWDVVRVYTDNSVSASKGVRPQWEQLLKGARGGAFDIVVAWALDRLVRRSSDLERLVETGVRAATVQGDLDLTTVQGELLGGILASVARAEVRQKGERQRAANLQRAEGGQMSWTRRPFGYDHDEGGKVIAVPAEMRALRFAAERVLAGDTVASAARMLDDRGLTTTAGKPWNVTSLRRALLNPRYAGTVSYNGSVMGTGRWPVILDAETQSQLADVLRDPARRVQQGTTIKWLLSGIALCGRCGEPTFASPMGPRDGRWMVYRCRTGHLARRLDLVDEVVEGVMVARLRRRDALRLLGEPEDVSRLRSLCADLRERRDAVGELVADGLLSPAAARTQAEKLAVQIRDAEARIGGVEQASPAAAVAQSDDPQATWNALPIRNRRGIIETLATVTLLPAGKGVRFDPEHVQIEWRRA